MELLLPFQFTKSISVPGNLRNSKMQVSDKQKHKQCKYCGKYMYHEMKREKCPVYGQTCRKCHKLNHFENKCTASTKHGPTVKKKVNTVYFGDSSDPDDYYQLNSVVSSDEVGTVNSSNCKTAHVTMLIQGQKFQFQLDTGASCNIIPEKHSSSLPPLCTCTTDYKLRMYNSTTIKPLGKLKLSVTTRRTR